MLKIYKGIRDNTGGKTLPILTFMLGGVLLFNFSLRFILWETYILLQGRNDIWSWARSISFLKSKKVGRKWWSGLKSRILKCCFSTQFTTCFISEPRPSSVYLKHKVARPFSHRILPQKKVVERQLPTFSNSCIAIFLFLCCYSFFWQHKLCLIYLSAYFRLL